MKYGLNIGCGTRLFKSSDEVEWVNLDAVAGEGVDIVADWRELKAASFRSYDYIVAFHTYEHQGCGEQPIRQCYDMLTPMGSLIVCVPDLWKLADLWKSGQISTQIYMTNIYGPFDGTEESRHRWGFDHDSLFDQLQREAPWARVTDFDYRYIPGTDIPRDDRWMLTLEACK